MSRLDPTEKAAWRGFLRVHSVVWQQLDSQLQRDFGLNLAAYELLLTLEEQGELRMSDLAAQLRYSAGGLTRLADRLQQAGYIERRRCPEDGRGFWLQLTRSGQGQLRRMHVLHLRGVRELFLGHLSDAEQRALAAIWAKLGGQVGA